MTISERTTETVLDALAERIRDLKMDIYLKDSEISRLKEKNAELSKKLEEAGHGNKN